MLSVAFGFWLGAVELLGLAVEAANRFRLPSGSPHSSGYFCAVWRNFYLYFGFGGQFLRIYGGIVTKLYVLGVLEKKF